MTKYFYIILLCLILSAGSTSQLFAQEVTLSWDASPTAGVTGYKICYKQNDSNPPFDGVGANEGSSPVDAGNTLSTTLTGLDDNTTYYFAVTAYNATNNESTFSNVVSLSNGETLSLVRPLANAVNEPIPVTFQWEFSSSATLNYTLFYGTNSNLVQSAGAFGQVYPSSPLGNKLLFALFSVIPFLFWICNTSHKKAKIAIGVLATCLALSACGGNGSGDSNLSSSKAATDTPSSPDTQALYSIDKGTSDYHQAFDLQPGTTYYWKVVGVDTTDPTQVYTSTVASFTTENY